MTARRAVRPAPAEAAPPSTAAPLRVVLVGHVDHGKSTLTGRLLADSGALPEGKLESVRASCARRGVPFEMAFVLDALEAERDQNVTIDASTVWLRLPERTLVLVDAPGHREFLRNMVTGAAAADAAVLLVAADEGVREQSRRHAQLLALLGIEDVVVVVNKLDRVDRSEQAFRAVETELGAFLASVGVTARAFIPVVAREGENIVARSPHMPWYAGRTVLDELLTLEGPRPNEELPLRLFVQDVYRFDDRRIIAGRIDAGVLRTGDRLRFLPSGAVSTVKTIERWAAPSTSVAVAGDSVGLTLTDPIFVERGQVATPERASPSPSSTPGAEARAHVGRRLRARVFWLGKRTLDVERRLKLRLCTLEADARVVAVERVVDAGSLSSSDEAKSVKKDEVADVVLETRAPIAFDSDRRLQASARFVLVDDRDVAGGGIITGALDDEAAASTRAVDAGERARRFGHTGAAVVIPGSLDPNVVERALFERGLAVALADDRRAAQVLAAAGLIALACGFDVPGALRPFGGASLDAPDALDALVDVVVAAVSVSGRRAGRTDAA